MLRFKLSFLRFPLDVNIFILSIFLYVLTGTVVSAQDVTTPLHEAAIANSEKALSISREAIANVQPENPALVIDPAAQQRALEESAEIIDQVNTPGWSVPATTVPSIFGNTLNNPTVDIEALSQSGHRLQDRTNTDEERYTSRIFIFVSSSMPTSTLRNYIEQAALAKASIVFRGMVGDSLLSTREYLYTLIGQHEPPGNNQGAADTVADTNNTQAIADAVNVDIINPGDIKFLIDPTLFRLFNVQTVPTLVVTETPITPCETEHCAPPDHHRVRGDVSLAWGLDLVSRQSGSAAMKELLHPVTQQLRGQL